MKGKSRIIRIVLIAAILGYGYWKRGQIQGDASETARSSEPTAVLKDIDFTKEESKGGKPTAILKKVDFSKQQTKAEKVRGYDKFTNTVLIKRDGNDGDSFFVKAGGREFEFRLYFVDAPEKYLSDRYENQRRRVAEQASEMGGITPEQAVEVGLEAKAYTESQLEGKTFTIYTQWEEVYDGERYYGFVELPDGSYLGNHLVEQGLARIHTKGPGSKENPIPTPRGDSFHEHRDYLGMLERKAQKAKRGAWGK
ncbi:thermonuclease family protein [Verrucomicrobiales bacterium BCK34]|nr:thermonuclease family protein [Verrucomicrobiales bacterium BCK34]